MQMSYALIVRTQHGWTDNLGQQDADSNRWETVEAATAAINELSGVLGVTAHDFKIVEADSLDSLGLIA